MKRILTLAMVFVFACASISLGFGLKDLAKSVTKLAAAKDVPIKLSDISGDLKSYEGGDYDPSSPKGYSYKSYGDAQWDDMAKSAAHTALCVDFAEKILASEKATGEDQAAALKALEPLATELPALITKIAGFVTGLAGSPEKVLMLKEVKSVSDSLTTVVEKAPKIVKALKDKALAAKEKQAEGQ